MIILTKATDSTNANVYLKNFIKAYNAMLEANVYTDGNRVTVLYDEYKDLVIVYVCGKAKVIDPKPYTGFGIMCEINKAIEELY